MRNQDLLQRQRALRLRSQQLRQALARDAGALARPVNPVDAAARVLALCVRRPGLPLAALLLVLMARRLAPGLGLLQRAWWLWRGWSSLRRWLLG